MNVHSKIIVVDDAVCEVGSYNMDPMSQNINSEAMAVVKETSFARRHRLRIERDIERSFESRIEVQPDGTVRALAVPSRHLHGFYGALIKVIARFGLLRPLV